MEDNIDTDREGYGNLRGNFKGPLSPDPRSSVKFQSIEERNDSGLGSLGYSSLDYNHASLSQLEEEQNDSKENISIPLHPDKAIDSGSNFTLSTDLANSLSRLNIGSLENKLFEQCDSGVDDEKDSLLAARPLLTQCSNLHWVSPKFTPNQIVEIFRGDEDGDTHLHLSIIHNLPEVTMQIIGLAPGSDWLNQTNNMQQTPLHIAVLTRQVAVVRRLVCAGACVDVRDQMGNTPLHSACVLGFEDIVQELLSPVRAEETYQNRYKIPYQRIPQDLEMKNYEGLTCLHLSAIAGHFNITKRLLSCGANINAAEGKSGRTILHFAADWGNIRMTDFLLSYREADIDAKTYSGLTAILLAWGRQHVELANFLYSRGASLDSQGEESDADASDEEMCNEPCAISSQRPIQPVY
ncbi:inhibitor protein kappa b-like protein [Plakobranchus ocellatus]|uniref:Inhibitor protein kappa b-like protein n=1 Tax=Plakobranchus ocellatus TaxID=259542 RepID=A0AAV4DVB7_9GAST|nr:inhibitor protein kappa b-like protein [Plakobranchus ocellatus]